MLLIMRYLHHNLKKIGKIKNPHLDYEKFSPYYKDVQYKY